MTMPAAPTRIEDVVAYLATTIAELKREQVEFEARFAREQAERDAARAQAEAVRQAEREATREAAREAARAKDKADVDAARREHNKTWGDLANKMGTIVEDLVAPSVERIVQEVFGVPPEATDILARVTKRLPTDRSQMREFDVIVAWPGYLLVNETKSSLDAQDVKDLIEGADGVRDYFPEYADRKIVLCVASLSVKDLVLRFAEERGVLVLAVGDQLMDVMNSTGFRPREF